MIFNIDKYEGIKYLIDSLYDNKEINEDTIIIIPVLKYLKNEILKIRDNYKNKLIFVLYQNELNDILDTSIECITIPNNFKEEEIFNMALDIKEEYDNAYLLDLSNNKPYINYYSKIVAKELSKKYIDIDKLFIPYIYGGLYKGISNYFKLVLDAKIYLINYRDELLDKNIDYDYIVSKDEIVDDEKSLVIL